MDLDSDLDLNLGLDLGLGLKLGLSLSLSLGLGLQCSPPKTQAGGQRIFWALARALAKTDLAYRFGHAGRVGPCTLAC